MFRLLIFIFPLFLIFGCSENPAVQFPDHQQLASQYFNEDKQWYLDNIPFFECSDTMLQQVYYYRWKMYKAHIRNTGADSFVITEFIVHMPWDKEPWCTINAASMHHIYEGRWLKDNRYINGYLNHLYTQGGNNRNYSESIADAAYAHFLVNADTAFLLQHLDTMKSIYNGWSDHWDSSKNLYYIPAMPDATEYNIAGVDASGGKAGFDSGVAFRPTINSYMYANAKAISKIAAFKNDRATADEYAKKAAQLRNNVMEYLWNDSLQHFSDRYKQDNQYVHYWDFIRGRELAGYAPWYFSLPENNTRYFPTWKYITDTGYLSGPYGLRTNEPTYEYYFRQYAYYKGRRSSQWNGPNWPFQSSIAITAMANFLNDYKQDVVTVPDYLRQLRSYAKQHYLPDGKINLVENYDPDKGGPIVYEYWSNHYNHSSFNNLIISGLCGIRPSEGDSLTINPLIDSSIHYFYLSNLYYHGHRLRIIYDEDGKKYNAGKGLQVWVDDKKVSTDKSVKGYRVFVGPALKQEIEPAPENIALNIRRKNFPVASASINASQDTTLYKPLDGRIWYFPEVNNFWSTDGSVARADWFALDFGQAKDISTVKIYFYADGKSYNIPKKVSIEYESAGEWKPVKFINGTPLLNSNTVTEIVFEKASTKKLRVVFERGDKNIAITELEVFGPALMPK